MDSADSIQTFSPSDLEQLKGETLVRQVEHHGVLPSTNSYASSRAMDPQQQLPLLVMADRQTAGRGRGSNQWWSPAGALTFSLVLERPESLGDDNWPQVALTTGIAVCETLHQLCPGLDAGLKWPNDVFVSSRKICGILVESPGTIRRMVIGVGINVNNRLSEAPEPIRSTATSLVEVAGFSFRLLDVLLPFLKRLFALLNQLHHDPKLLQHRWETYCMLTGQTVQVTAGSHEIVGTCRGIDAYGALLVETSSGITPCHTGEASVRLRAEDAR